MISDFPFAYRQSSRPTPPSLRSCSWMRFPLIVGKSLRAESFSSFSDACLLRSSPAALRPRCSRSLPRVVGSFLFSKLLELMAGNCRIFEFILCEECPPVSLFCLYQPWSSFFSLLISKHRDFRRMTPYVLGFSMGM